MVARGELYVNGKDFNKSFLCKLSSEIVARQRRGVDRLTRPFLPQLDVGGQHLFSDPRPMVGLLIDFLLGVVPFGAFSHSQHMVVFFVTC